MLYSVVNTFHRIKCAFVMNMCFTVTLRGNGPVGPNSIPVSHISDNCIPCHRADIQLTYVTVSSVNRMCTRCCSMFFICVFSMAVLLDSVRSVEYIYVYHGHF